MGKHAATPGDTGSQKGWQQLPLWRKIEVWLFGSFTAAGALFMVSYPWLESQQEWVQCQVVETSSARGRYNPHFVSVKTNDCDKIAYSVGVTEENVESIAASIKPGEYEFLIGWWSRQFMKYDIFPGATGAQDFRKVP